MSEFTDLPFSASDQGLFSSAEMRGLMASEIFRARRYGFPVTLFLVGVDRLDALHDLYGVSSKSEILSTVLNHLRNHVRASDFVGSLEGDRLLLLSPYSDRAGSKTLAARLLSGARQLRFASDNRDLQVTLSIGMAHAPNPEPASEEALFRAADDAQRMAQGKGGDQVLEIDLLDTFNEDDPVAPPPKVERPSRQEPAGESAPSPENPLAGLAPADIVTVVRDALVQLGLDPLWAHPPALSAAPAPTPTPAPSAPPDPAPARPAPSDEEYDLQDRRIAKLAKAVETLQAQLSSMSTAEVADQGVASLGKVFGALGEGGESDDQRKELMGALFKANLSLQKRRSDAADDTGSAGAP